MNLRVSLARQNQLEYWELKTYLSAGPSHDTVVEIGLRYSYMLPIVLSTEHCGVVRARRGIYTFIRSRSQKLSTTH